MVSSSKSIRPWGYLFQHSFPERCTVPKCLISKFDETSNPLFFFYRVFKKMWFRNLLMKTLKLHNLQRLILFDQSIQSMCTKTATQVVIKVGVLSLIIPSRLRIPTLLSTGSYLSSLSFMHHSVAGFLPFDDESKIIAFHRGEHILFQSLLNSLGAFIWLELSKFDTDSRV